MGWTANIAALSAMLALTTVLALALLWRVTQWQVHPAEVLTFQEGLAVGSVAKEVAAYAPEGHEVHLSFGGVPTFLVFGNEHCEPCNQLLGVASTHPATRHMRLVSLSDGEGGLGSGLESRWEQYRYHDEEAQRRNWRAPVSPYFHVIDGEGRVVAKGVANHPGHLDRLLEFAPPAVRVHTLGDMR